MHEVKLEEGGSRSATCLKPILHEMAVSKELKVKVYHLKCMIAEVEYIFQTTSKEVFLSLGAFSFGGLECLAILIQFELNEAGDDENQCLLTYAEEENRKKNGLLVSRIASMPKKVTYNISPAH